MFKKLSPYISTANLWKDFQNLIQHYIKDNFQVIYKFSFRSIDKKRF